MKRNKVVAICDGFPVHLKIESNGRMRHYLYIKGRRVWLHHYLAEKYIRLILPGEVIHHKDHNSINNSIFNLEIMSRADHVITHTPVKGYKFTEEQRAKLSNSHIGQCPWNKGRKNCYSQATIQKFTKATKQQLIDFLRNNPNAKADEIKRHFNFNSYGPIAKNGGLKSLKAEVVRA